ncbi:MAG: hypothetical protein ACLPY5_09215 [Candidatus Bathyarchaeia archaeon]
MGMVPSGTYVYSIKFSIPSSGGSLYIYGFTADNTVTLSVIQASGLALPGASWSTPGYPSTGAGTDWKNWYPTTGSPITQDLPTGGQYTLEANVFNGWPTPGYSHTGLAVYAVLCPSNCSGPLDLNTGNALASFTADPTGTPDTHWKITNFPLTTLISTHVPFSAVPPVAGWFAPPLNTPGTPPGTANWISPYYPSPYSGGGPNGSSGVGAFTYSISFSVPSACQFSSLIISGYAGDNDVQLSLDSKVLATDTSTVAYQNLHSPISISVGAGSHTLTAVVTNTPATAANNPTGLLVIAYVKLQ